MTTPPISTPASVQPAAPSAKPAAASNRQELTRLLGVASELEHGLALQYLFTAFTLKDRIDEGGMTGEELQYVLRWKANIFFVAAQEMQHLVQATNLLLALGDGPHLSRPNFPQPPRYYPTNLPWGLHPFSEATVRLYAVYERPAYIPPAEACGQLDPEDFGLLFHGHGRRTPHAQEMARLVAQHDPDSVKHDHNKLPWLVPLRPRATTVETIGELYGMVADAFRFLNPGDLIRGDPALQVAPDECDFPQVRRIATRDDAIDAIELLVQQGEGGLRRPPHEVIAQDPHYQVFCRILCEYRALRQRNPHFDPVRDVQHNPLSRLHADTWWPFYRVIKDDLTRAINDLNSSAYTTMLTMIEAFFAIAGQRERRLRYARGFLRMMMQVIKPLGELITQLPMGEDKLDRWAKNAGPSFELTRFFGALPASQPVAALIVDRLHEDAATAARLALAPGAPRASLLQIAGQLNAIAAAFPNH